MIRVARRKAPRGFNEKVRRPGDRWLASHPQAKRVPSYWRRVRRRLIAAFQQRCAYTAMWLSHDGQIDHFVSIDEDRRKAYRWSNLRYSAGWFNAVKQSVRSSRILDPFQVEDGWFEILLPSFELTLTDRCPPALRPKATFMLEELGLGKSERVIMYRREWYRMYEEGLSLDELERRAPLIARAIRKQQPPA